MRPTPSALAAAGGAVLAYALDAAQRAVCLRSQLPLISEEAPVQWVHVAYEGEWQGHPAGPFKFTRERFEEAVRNLDRQANPAKLDFDHETDVTPPGTSVPARGWVHRLAVEDGPDGRAHLWALVEFGPEAVRKNREGGYRYCSGVFYFDATDRQTGESIGLYMPRLSLTDDPFVDGQKPIRLSCAAPIALSNEDTMKIKKADFLSRLRKIDGDEVSVEQITKLAQSMGLLDEAMSGGGGGDEPADRPEGDGEPAAMSAALSADGSAPAEPVAAAAETPPEAPAEPGPEAEAVSLLEQAMEATGLDLPALIEALRGLMAGGEPAAAVAPLNATIEEQAVLLSARDATIKTLSARAETAEARVKQYEEAEADAAVDLLVASGRLLDTGRDAMRALYLSNRAQFDAMAAALPEVVPVGKHAAEHTPPTEETPAINEDDPWVKERRRQLSATWLGRDEKAIENAIRRELAIRNKNNGVRV